jgi:hypothetical protein
VPSREALTMMRPTIVYFKALMNSEDGHNELTIHREACKHHIRSKQNHTKKLKVAYIKWNMFLSTTMSGL